MTKITTILFDIGDVIITGIKTTHFSLGKKLNEKPQKVEDALHTKHLDEFFLGEISEEQYIESVIKHLHKKNILTTKKMIKESIRSHFYEIEHMFELIKHLKKKFNLVLLSNNGNEWVQYLGDQFPIKECFRHRFYSCDLGMQKPNPKIYKHVLKELRLKPQEVFYVDDYPKNIAAAKKLGIRSTRFTTRRELENDLSKI